MVTPGEWRKSSRSGNAGGNCVEARRSTSFEVRDSKLGDDSPILTLSPEDFVGFLKAVR